MISNLDAIQFYGIKELLEGKEKANLQELEFRIQKVNRSLQGGARSNEGFKKNILELCRVKEIIVELLAIHGLGDGSGVQLFDKLINDEKALRKKGKQQKLKNKRYKQEIARKRSKKPHNPLKKKS